MMLNESRRQQLDTIVKQMVANKEPDANIQAVVADFKKKYEGASQSQPAAPQPQRNILQRAGDFLKSQVTGSKQQYGTAGSIVDETVGSKGLLGVAQMPGKVAGQFGLVKDQTATDESRAALAEQTRQLAIKIRSLTDPNERARLQRVLDDNRKALELVGESSNDLDSRSLTSREAVATTVRAGSTVATGTGGATKNLALKGASKLAPGSAKTVQAVVTAGKGVVPRAVEQAGINMGFNAAGNIEQGKPLNEGAGEAGAVGAVIPVTGTIVSKSKNVLSKGSDTYAARVINSLIKPLSKDFSFGKNPGRGVAAEGIVFNDLVEDGIPKIIEARQRVGQNIGKFIKGTTWRFEAEDAFQPLVDAMEAAKKAPRTNREVIKRLDDITQDLLQISNKGGKPEVGRKLSDLSGEELFQLKEDVAELTKFTGNASDDQLVNKTLKQMYGKLSDKLEKAIPEIKAANERYGDLKSAEIAARYRDKIEQRANLVSLGGKVSAIGAAVVTVISTGGSAIPALLAGAGMAGLQKALGSPRVKTRMAKWLASAKPAEKKALFEKVPALRNAVERVFGY